MCARCLFIYLRANAMPVCCSNICILLVPHPHFHFCPSGCNLSWESRLRLGARKRMVAPRGKIQVFHRGWDKSLVLGVGRDVCLRHYFMEWSVHFLCEYWYLARKHVRFSSLICVPYSSRWQRYIRVQYNAVRWDWCDKWEKCEYSNGS